jgi:signal transduction histidine kinase/PAS domain-containing protein/ActR/RegA family two-component response regulator
MGRKLILESWAARCLFAAGVFGLATGLNFVVQPLVAGRTPMLPYFPALVLTGLCSGFIPGIAVLVAASVAVLSFWAEPLGVFWPPAQAADLIVVLMFAVDGAMVLGVSSWARHLLRQSAKDRNRLSMALEAGQMASWDWDLRSGRVSMSAGAAAVFGKRWSNIETGWHLTHPDDVARLASEIDVALTQGTSYSVVHRIYRGEKKELRWVQNTGHVHRDNAGKAVRVSGVTIDVTERQLALLASRAAEERLELALEFGKVTVWETDAEGVYTWVHNLQLGLKPETLLGRHMGDVMRNTAFLANVEPVYSKGEPVKFQLAVPHEDTVLHYLCSVRAEKDSAGDVKRVIGASVDVTELNVTQEKLRQESQRKDTFLATLAHELRNPMAPIRYAVAMLGDETPPARREHAREVISRQAAHMARLLDDLLDMSRITRNAIELRPEVVDLRMIAEQAAESVRPAFAELKQRLVLSLPPDAVLVNGDPTRLQQVLGNILDNAAKYSEAGGEVTLRVDSLERKAVVRVKDSGIGIAPEQLGTVFELFTQLQPHGRGKGGLGIGLAVVRQLVELHGGTVSVASEGPGKGSEFTVTLPVATPVPQEPSMAPENKVVALFQRSKTALVVDDNRDAAELLALLLREEGYAVTIAYDGAGALEAFASVKPALVLLDIGLPDMSGLDVAKAIRQRSEGPVSLVAVSGWGQRSDREQSAAAGFDLHLVKPVEPQQLLSLLSHVAAHMQASG